MILHEHTNSRRNIEGPLLAVLCNVMYMGGCTKKGVRRILLGLVLFNIVSSGPDDRVESKFIKLKNDIELGMFLEMPVSNTIQWRYLRASIFLFSNCYVLLMNPQCLKVNCCHMPWRRLTFSFQVATNSRFGFFLFSELSSLTHICAFQKSPALLTMNNSITNTQHTTWLYHTQQLAHQG